MTLCPECRLISLSFLLQEDEEGRPPSDTIKDAVLRQNGATLAESALGCPMCALLVEALLQCLSSDDPVDSRPLLLSEEAITAEVKSDGRAPTFHSAQSGGAYLTGFIVTAKEKSGQMLRSKVRLYVDETVLVNSSGRCDVNGRPALSHPGDAPALSLVNRWVQACQQHHRHCSSTLSGATIDESISPPLPTRVLSIADGQVKLFEPAGLTGRYVALSHCWGEADKRPLRTMLSSLQKHKNGIPWDTLPKTFQDAILVTRGIGIDFLWIDSLCIIQDEQDDWLRESGQMGAIYEQADLTIAASHAADSWQGFLTPRKSHNTIVHLPSFFGQDTPSRPEVYASVRRESVLDTFPEHGPLNRRAWATQEWLLSRRMVFYTTGTVLWSCKMVTERENGERCFNISRNTKWKSAVEQYSDRELTFPTDKLVALEGLRIEIQKKLGSTYLHGIWQDCLPDQLLWQVTSQVSRRVADPLGLPTWTWAHVTSGARFLPIHGAKSLCDSIKVSRDLKTLTILSKCKQVGSLGSHLDEHRTSAISEVIIADTRASHARDTASMAKYMFDKSGSPLGWVVYDSVEDGDSSTTDYCLQLMGSVGRRDEQVERRTGNMHSDKLREYWVIVIRGCVEGVYRRVGAGKTYGREWWQDEEAEEVLLY